jgi:biopolymer transport protein ExbB/TolQ
LTSIIQAAGWPIWPLIACSIFALAIILERLNALQTTKFLPEQALQHAIDITQQGFPSIADASASQQSVVNVLEAVRMNGVVKIAFATQNSSQANKPETNHHVRALASTS